MVQIFRVYKIVLFEVYRLPKNEPRMPRMI